MDIRQMLGPSVNWERIVPELDEVGDQVRIATVRELGQDDLARLFEGAAKHQALSLDELVPQEAGSAVVIHEGHHPGAWFPAFTSYFARRPADHDRVELIGYHAHSRWGFGSQVSFTVTSADDGRIALDYARPPTQPPTGWPTQPSGSAYRDRSDVLRRVSSMVSVGRTSRAGKPVNQWFALVRRTGRF
jgi:hypothetical protein